MTYENDGIKVEATHGCGLCGNGSLSLYKNLRDRCFGVPGLWNLLWCQHCKFAWIDPRPLRCEIGKLYLHYQTHEMDHPQKGMLGQIRKVVRRGILGVAFGYRNQLHNKLDTIVGRCLAHIGPICDIIGGAIMWLDTNRRGSLLDIGCGNGRFIADMEQLGWTVFGIEPDPQAVAAARNYYGVNVFEGTVEEIELSECSFDVVTINHVIEHLMDPLSTMDACYRLLKPGGLMVVRTPNINSLGHKLFGESWRGLECPRHLHLFSERSLKMCAELVGFRKITIRTTSRAARWTWASSRLLQRDGVLPGGAPGSRGFFLCLEGLLFQTIEYAMCFMADSGEELVMMTEK